MKTLLLFLLFALTGCWAYRIVPENNQALIATLRQSEQVSEVKVMENVSDLQACLPFNDLRIFILTLGLVPDCKVRLFTVSLKEPENELVMGTVRFTQVTGWIALLLAPLPNWQYTFLSHETNEARVREFMMERTK